MRLEPLYRITFSARRERTGAGLPDLHGAVETEDGATVLLDLTGRGRPDADPAGRVVGSVTHTTEDGRYRWLNETVGALAGEVYRGDRVVLDVAELVWEPLGEAPGYDPGET
jgi:hypothetical protein